MEMVKTLQKRLKSQEEIIKTLQEALKDAKESSSHIKLVKLIPGTISE